MTSVQMYESKDMSMSQDIFYFLRNQRPIPSEEVFDSFIQSTNINDINRAKCDTTRTDHAKATITKLITKLQNFKK